MKTAFPDSLKIDKLSIESRTMFITLAARAAASEMAPDIGFEDLSAKYLVNMLPLDLKVFETDVALVRSVALRASLFDKITADFLECNPDAVIINFGCGLCSRYERMRDRFSGFNRNRWFDIDFPDVIDLRRKYMPQLSECTVAIKEEDDISWLHSIAAEKKGRLLLLMEGVVPYFEQKKIEKFFMEFGRITSDCGLESELLFDYIHPSFAGADNMSKNYGNSYATYNCGFVNADSIKRLHPDFRLKQEYHIFSGVSAHHALFEKAFNVHTKGEWPYTVSHFQKTDPVTGGGYRIC